MFAQIENGPLPAAAVHSGPGDSPRFRAGDRRFHWACISVFDRRSLPQVCERNRREREKEWPRAERIIEEETARFMADLHHRATAPTIKRLKARADEVKAEELPGC